MINSYRPIRTNWKTQEWGENKACIKTSVSGNAVYPVSIRPKIGNFCEPGYKDFYTFLGMKGHNGVDWATWHGEPCYHCDEFEGWAKLEYDDSGGLGVDIVSLEPMKYCPDCDEMHYVKRRFWHGMKITVMDKERICPGDMVMYCDNTGASSGDHLHTSLKWCNKEGVGIHTDNGWCGAFQDEHFENTFICEHLELEAKVLTLTEQVKAFVMAVRAYLLKK